MPPEYVSSYPKAGWRHFYACALIVAIFAALGGARIALALDNFEASLDTWLSIAMPFAMAASTVSMVFAGLVTPQVRIGPDWIETYEWHAEKLERVELRKIVRLFSEDADLICFELTDGDLLALRRSDVGRFDWQALRGELALRLDFYDPLELAPSALPDAPEFE